MQGTNSRKWGVGIIGLLVSASLIFFFSDVIVFLENFNHKYLTAANTTESYTSLKLKLVVVSFIVLTVLLCLLFITNIYKRISLVIGTFININEVVAFFTIDKLCRKKKLASYVLLIATSFGLLLPFLYLVFDKPLHEGIIEESSSLLFLVSALILIGSTTMLKQTLVVHKSRIRLLLLLVSIIPIFIFGEEVSWGQRIFGWDSFGVFSEYNFQKETNFHNFLNPLNKFLYPLFGMSMFLVLFFVWFFPKDKYNYLFNLFMPHQSLFFLVFLMACSSCFKSFEPFEELLSVFFLLYSLRIFLCIKFPAKE